MRNQSQARLMGLVFAFGILVWWAFLLLISPLILLYAFVLLCGVWFQWAKRKKDVLVVTSDDQVSQERLNTVTPLLETWAEFLNWSERKSWRTWTLAPQLFRFYAFFFGPEPFEFATSLPAVIVFKRFQRPKSFHFARSSNEGDSVLHRLQAELDSIGRARGDTLRS
jgi:hypothetical protein